MAVSRFMIAAAGSGSGKTVISCALMAAFQEQGRKVTACKCGPDYIDPMFHKEVLGIESENLDLYFCEAEVLRRLFEEHIKDAEVAITEGVMGYYDGMSLDSDQCSSYEVADKLGLPVILVVPCRGMALSVVPWILGMLAFKEESHIKGVILNRISGRLYPKLKEMVESELQKKGYEIPVIGYVPEDEVFTLESRHLGLVTPQEIDGIRSRLRKAGELLSGTVELERLLEIGGTQVSAPPKEADSPHNGSADCFAAHRPHGDQSPPGPVRIGLAMDQAFCFYYKDNLNLLRRMGCELIPFSPLRDSALPEEIQGLIFGGGYPELFTEQLSDNQTMRTCVRLAVSGGMPCLAECGGFLYLHESLEGKDGTALPMAGVIRGSAFRTDRLVRFGYIQLQAQKDGAYLQKGDCLKGHEFHYWDSPSNGADCHAVKPDGRRSFECIHMEGNLFAGFPHIYFYSNIRFAERFVGTCRKWQPVKQSSPL